MKTVFCSLLVLLVASGVYSKSLPLPSYISACTRSDPKPKLNQCAVDEANKALPKLYKGDKKYNIPELLPLIIPEIAIDSQNGLNIKMSDVKVINLDQAKVSKADIDIPNKHMVFTVEIPMLILDATYDISGRILILPISGNGPCLITVANGVYTYTLDYDLVQKDGEEFIKISKHDLNFETTKATFKFDNLFNGDENLGREMNEFLNKNWEDVVKDLGPAIAQSVSTLITAIVEGFTNKIKYDDFLLP